MVEKIKKIIRETELKKGGINLFMLRKEDSNIDTWSVVISANWIDDMPTRKALDFWTLQLQKNLSREDLKLISRISFIKVNDPFIQTISRTLAISKGSVRFTNNYFGNYHISDAIIFEAKNIVRQNELQTETNKNPLINGRINPNINGRINPNINGRINPNINGRINPNINGRINPNINGRINPNINLNLTNLNLYDLSLNKIAYFIEVEDKILLMFDYNNNFTSYLVHADQDDIFNFFDANDNQWTGYLVSNKENGYNYFSINGDWLGFAT